MQGDRSQQCGSFGMIYQDRVPADHLLHMTDSAVNLDFVRELVADCHCPDDSCPSWDPLVLSKTVLLQFIYDLSDRQVEEQVNLHLACVWSAGLRPEQRGPDHVALCRFHTRLGLAKPQAVPHEIVAQTR